MFGRPTTEKLANRAEIHTGHHESRRKSVTVAMPRIIGEASSAGRLKSHPQRIALQRHWRLVVEPTQGVSCLIGESHLCRYGYHWGEF